MGNAPYKVMVVDDTKSNIDILLETLGDTYEVRVAMDGEIALEDIAKEVPDLILLDVMMPGMDGYQVCKTLKSDEKTADIPVIFLTALTEEQDESKGLWLGAVDYITKPFSPDLVKARVSNQLELKAHRDQLEKMVENRTAQLRQALGTIKALSLDTIYRLSRAAEFKDEDTGAHIQRMSRYSAAVARKMGLNDRVVESILYSAPMHDIGKIGTPDRILLKPGKLDADEWKIMKLHTINGGKILEGSDKGFVKLGEIIALTHHEKWDGSGYPNGLYRNEIPLLGRIVAISDVFDALTTRRPYKEPFTLEKSYRIIREGSGKHFDPAVVDAFFAAEKEILAIKEKYKDEGESLLYKFANGR